MDIAANAIKRKNISVWIMAEGTRSKGRGLLPFKKGAFITAIKAQVPIVPIVISSYTKHLNLSQPKAGKIIVEVLDPIPTIGLSKDEVNTLKDKTHFLMKEALNKLDQEIEVSLKNSNE